MADEWMHDERRRVRGHDGRGQRRRRDVDKIDSNAESPESDEGGCTRCAERAQAYSRKPKYKSGTGDDICICVHAEQNALLAAARFGIPVAGGLIYTTIQPCFGCLKEMVQAHIEGIRYRHPWSHPDTSLKPQYDVLKAQFRQGVKQVLTPDPREAWALGRGPRGSDTGHPIQR